MKRLLVAIVAALGGATTPLRFVRFFTLSCARCGSSYVDEMLDSHPCVYTMGEKLPLVGAVDVIRHIVEDEARAPTAAEWRAAQDRAFEAAERLAERAREKRLKSFAGCGAVAVGGKLPYERLRLNPRRRFDDVLGLFAPVATNASAAAAARVVLATRRNSLDRVLSRFAPALFDAEHACTARTAHCLRRPNATVDVAWLAREVGANEALLKTVRGDALTTADRVGAPVLALFYEDALRDAALLATRVLPFLGLAPARLTPTVRGAPGHVKRTANLTHADLLANYGDVAAALAAAGLADALVDEATRHPAPPADIVVLNPPP